MINELEFERKLVYHCAPTLDGMKSANMFALCKNAYELEKPYILYYKKLFGQWGIQMTTLKQCRQKVLILVYRKEALAGQLNQKEVDEFLRAQGYSQCVTLEEKVMKLKERMSDRSTFPHEIGLFLGYPLDDVVGFMKNNGRECKLNGYWKVYSNVEQARELFEQFTQCRNQLSSRIENGVSIEQILHGTYWGKPGERENRKWERQQ
ncbi:DUF3793 family protein [Sinanaerobacter chloroacetimidivorans]|jgi:cell fate (sporulation/competence/biofilm development) regulator YlbF (YheA/YmcA/DUF963 family)|uniref:DUF3793 family protein n=1 Tax=Sinanaerobacter chloroacetimidivorans TaxID=2818044 RepID=A0A8J7W3H2_9FIRM|nr:DUF3793 family protein [Sinanaerobacter chloroacetimidivorans]MBR0600207.1 DUF3793 family protein [Sinanaerobacter chloroacetimidivorans]